MKLLYYIDMTGDDDDEWCFTATFVYKVGYMGQPTSKGNEVKSKMKQPSDMPTSRFEHCGSDLWSNTLPLDHGVAQIWRMVEWIGMLHFVLKDGFALLPMITCLMASKC